MRVSEIMQTRVKTVGVDEPADQAWNLMRLHRIRHLVVTRDADVVGVLSDRDLGGARGQTIREGRSAGDLMSGDVISVPPTTTIREAANLMRGRTISCLPVLDRTKLVGIVSVFDLLELIGRGAERPVARARRWVMKGRGPRRKRANPS